ncbi:hypothetical protein DL770_002150 [Monosporascus sp. CRB-9-2]|nr:hypothetical protein DL770_002150 [Monosporascus sp. CRB-9-2]
MYKAEEARVEGELVDGAGPNGAILDDTERDRGIVPYPPLDRDECKDGQVKHDKQRHEAPAVPFVCVAAPAQGARNYGWDEEYGADGSKRLIGSKALCGGPGAAVTYKFFGESSARRRPSYSSYSIRAASQGAEQKFELRFYIPVPREIAIV